jgi:hypothetical protein
MMQREEPLPPKKKTEINRGSPAEEVDVGLSVKASINGGSKRQKMSFKPAPHRHRITGSQDF